MPTSAPIEVRDMRIIHETFRNNFNECAHLLRKGSTPSPQRVTFLADHIDFSIDMLHHHHVGEDELLYPLLLQRQPTHAKLISRVDEQHQEVSGGIASVSNASTAWRREPSTQTAGQLADLLTALNDTLEPHLDEEENEIVPLAAVTVSQEEWNALAQHGMASMPKDRLPIAFGMITEPLNAEDKAFMKSHLPGPVRVLFPVLVQRPWKKYAATLRNGT